MDAQRAKTFGRVAARVAAALALSAAAGCATRTGGAADGAAAPPAARPAFDWGPLASRQTDPLGRERTRALGPLVEWSRGPGGETLRAVRPFYAAEEDPASGWLHRDFLWPVGSSARLKDRHLSWRVLLAYGTRFDLRDPRSRYRVWVLPVWFQGRDARKRPYFAVFPVGGRIHEFLGQDTIDFALFPLWMRTRVNEVVTQDVLWPVFSRTRGKGIERFRVFPFYGVSKHRDRFRKRFVLWPVYTSARYDYPTSKGGGYVVFPLWGHIRLSDQQTWFLLPPFFRVDRGQRLNAVSAPWPFLRFGSGERDRAEVWPLAGRVAAAGRERSYLAWPVGWRVKVDRGDRILRGYKVLPFWQYESQVARRPGPDGSRAVCSRDVLCWPLFRYTRTNDVRRFRLLSLWPVRDAPPVERNWAPFWTLAEHGARGAAASESELLWGLWRRVRHGDGRLHASLFPLVEWDRAGGAAGGGGSWSVLKGLVGWRREGSDSELRLGYVLRIATGSATPSSPGNQTTSIPR